MSTLHLRTKQLSPGMLGSMVRSIWPLAVGLGLAVVLHFFVKPMIGDFYAKVLLDIGINIVLAVSLTMVNGFTGQFSIGHAAFMMLGAYTSACIMYYGSMMWFESPDMLGGIMSSMLDGREAPLFTKADGLFALSLVAGGVVAAVSGFIVGLPSLRLKGDYLAIVTLGFGEIVRVLMTQTTDVLYMVEEVQETPVYLLPTKVGGALGFSGLPFYTSLFWVFSVVAITLIVAYRLKVSATGRAFLSIREDEVASEAMGVNTTQFKVRAFVIAAFFAGVAGGLFAHTVGVQLNPGELGFLKSFDIIIMVVLGGLGSISGAIVAAAALTILPELLRNPEPLLVMVPWLIGLDVVLAIVVAVRLVKKQSPRPFSTAMVLVTSLIALGFVAKWAIDRGVELGNYRMILFAMALVLMMILRPQGLFGVREVWEKSWWKSIVDGLRAPPSIGKDSRS